MHLTSYQKFGDCHHLEHSIALVEDTIVLGGHVRPKPRKTSRCHTLKAPETPNESILSVGIPVTPRVYNPCTTGIDTPNPSMNTCPEQ